MKHEFKEGVLDALIAAAVLPGLTEAPPSDEEINRFIQLAQANEPTDDEIAIFKNVALRVQNAVEGKKHESASTASSSLLMVAMNRKNTEEQFTQETEQGLDEARRAALEELRKKREEESRNDQ